MRAERREQRRAHDAVDVARRQPRVGDRPLRRRERELAEGGGGLPLDLALLTGFRRTVLTYLPGIDYGQTASYGAVAAAVNNPKAVRAVGSACATNPLPVVIPCHRVVRSDGAVGGYLGGTATKRQLLDLEAAA